MAVTDGPPNAGMDANVILCSTCRSIDFYSVMYKVSGEYSLSADDSDDSNATRELGTLDEIMTRAHGCHLCQLIINTARRRQQRLQISEETLSGHRLVSRLNLAKRIKVAMKARTSKLPTKLDGKPIRATLTTRHCCLYQGSVAGKRTYEMEVRRFVVDLKPCPWVGKELETSMFFQPFWKGQQEKVPASVNSKKPNADVSLDSTVKPLFDEIPISGSGREFKTKVDINLVKGWVHTCETSHGTTCSEPAWLGPSSSAMQLKDLRVIDVRDNCLVDAPANCRYFALSYVWGQTKQAQKQRSQQCTTRSTLKKLQAKNGLNTLGLPQTIKDAITFMTMIDERYLWVDSLCIVQDDEVEVGHNVARMDMVYAGAVATIIAAAGEDAHFGLPGIRKKTRWVGQERAKVAEQGGRSLWVMEQVLQGSNRDVQHSPWNSRGWTFQERLLSRRLIFFTLDEVYWICERRKCDEETILEEPALRVSNHTLGCYDEFDDDDPKFTRSALSSYVTQYSERSFTYVADALDAFQGITRRFEYLTGSSLHWGVPCDSFGQGLMWRFGMERRHHLCRIKHSDGQVVHVPFPSWSSFGWDGFLGGAHMHNQGDIINFYAVMSNGDVRLIENETPRDLDPDTLDRKPVVPSPSIEGEAGVISTHSLVDASSAELVEEMERSSDSISTLSRLTTWETLDELLGQSQGDRSITGPIIIPSAAIAGPVTFPSATEVDPAQIHDTGLLVFKTSHVRALTSQKEQDIEDHTAVLTAPDKETVVLKQFEVQQDPNSYQKPFQNTMYDYIVISKNYGIAPDAANLLNLMVIQWVDAAHGVANRVGLAHVLIDDWKKLDPSWRQVILA